VLQGYYSTTKNGFDALLEKYGYKREGMIYKCKHNDDTSIVLFCHFALASVLIGYLAGVSPFIMWHSFFLPPSSVTTIVSSEVKKGEVFFRCMQLGDTSHLYAAGEPISHSGLLPEIYEPGNMRNLD
jgi:probable phosphoglycerate mutase